MDFAAQGQIQVHPSLVCGEIEELYDLQADPNELRNLALEAESAETLAEYRFGAIAELKRTKAGLVGKMPWPVILHAAGPARRENAAAKTVETSVR